MRIFIIAAACLASASFAAKPIEIATVKRTTPVDYDKEVYPFLKANCISCHNKTTTKADLNLETVELMRKGGESGAAITPGKGAESLMVRSSAHLDDPPMPPKDNKVKAIDLTPEQLGLMKQWIDEGAKASPRKEQVIAWEPLPDAFKGIYASAITRDGHYAACSRGGQVFVYHVPTRQLITRLTDDALIKSGLYKNPGMAHRDLVPSLAFSPDGKSLASGSYREIKIWQRDDVESTQKLPADAARLAEHPANTVEIDVPDKKLHLTGGKDGNAIVTDAEKKSKVFTLAHGGEVTAVLASKDGTRYVTAGLNNTVKLWNAADGKLVAELKGEHGANEAAAQAARSAAYLLTETTYRQGELKLAEADLKKLQERVKKVTDDLKTAQDGVAPKQKARDEAVKAKDETEKTTKPALAAEATTDDEKKKRKEAEDKVTEAAKKAADAETELVRAKEAVTHQQLELKLANEHVAKQNKTIDEAKAALASAEQKQKAADEEAKKALATAAAHQVLTRAMVFSSDGSQLATAADDGLIHLWSASDGTALFSLPGSGPAPTSQRTIHWAGKALSVTSEDGSRTVHQLAQHWKLARTIGGEASPIKDRVNALRYSPDGKILAAGSGEYSRSGELTLWNAENGALVKALPDLHKDTVFSLSFTIDGHRLATGSADKTVKVLDTATWKMEKAFEGHTSHVLGVAWRGEGRTLASAGADNVVKIWDFKSGDRKKNIDSWEAEVTAVQFVGLTENFLAACGDKRVRLVSDAGAEVRVFPDCKDFMQSAAASEDGKIVIGGGQDGVLRIWDGVTAKSIAEFVAP